MRSLFRDAAFITKRVGEVFYDWRTQRGVLSRYPSSKIDRTVRIINQRRLTLGQNVTLQSGVLLHCGGMSWSHGQGGIAIGDHSVVSPHCIFYGAGTISIGHHFDCGPRVTITSSRSVYEPGRKSLGEEHHLAPVIIGNGVTLFSGSIISPGVTIGDHAVVAAGAVVLRDVPPGTFVAGVPARVISKHP